MKSYDELNAKMEAIKQKVIKTRISERFKALIEVKYLPKVSGLASNMLTGELTKGRKKK